jgi:hypothetical protein
MLWAGRATAQVRVFAQVEPSADIYVGQSFNYHIIIDGDNKAGHVDLTPLEKYNPQSIGNRDLSQTSISIINGRRTETSTKQYVMSYALTAERPGQINLPSVTVSIDGTSYRTNPVEVNILQPGNTDQLELEVILSERQCYIGQPVMMTVKFYRYANIRDYQFFLPVLQSDAFYVEEPDDEAAAQGKEYRVTRSGRSALLFTFSKILIPRRAGNIDLGAASISAEVAVGRQRSRSRDRFFDDSFFDGFFGSRTQYKRFMSNSQPLSLNVLPLPEEGKPAGFYGLVGRYTISASATPTKVNVGDPITLTIKIGGGRYLKPIQWPELEQVPELAENFKIPSEKASPTIENGYKVFTQTIRANNDNVTEIPSIALAYFDADKGRYEIVKSEPIKLDVSPTKILTGADLEGRDFDFAPVNKEVEAIKKGLSANYEDLDALTNQAFSPLAAAVGSGYAVIWAGPLALLIFSALIKFFTHTTPEKIAAKRRRAAAGKAIGQLKKIISFADGQRYELLASIMKQYIGERFDRSAGSLTSNDCFEVITATTKDTHTAERYKEIVAECEAARYASVAANIESAIDKKSRK